LFPAATTTGTPAAVARSTAYLTDQDCPVPERLAWMMAGRLPLTMTQSTAEMNQDQ